jgi:GntR family transcriptional regulator / MocR family aminotransferase
MRMPLQIERDGPEPLYRQVERQLRAAIDAGRLRPGHRLPSVRSVADELGVGRLTVATAYEQLAADGYVVARVGFGTVVAPHPPAVSGATDRLEGAGPRRRPADGPVRRPPIDPPAPEPANPGPAGRDGARLRFDLRAGPAGGPGVAVGPALERLLREAWRDLAEQPGAAAADPAGDPLLRATIASHLRATRGGRCESGQVVILSGALIGVSAVARLWLGGDAAAVVEDPGDPAFRRALDLAGARIVPAPIDRHGLRADTLPAAAVALVSPTVQVATGARMSLARRLRLLAWAAETGAILVEDGRADELALGAAAGPSLQGLDEDGRVVHLGGFASILHPGVQLGYAVVPPDLVAPFTAAVTAIDPGATPVQQRALGRFLADGHLDRHLVRVRRSLAERFDAALEGARRDLGWLASTEAPAGGTRLVLTIEDERWTATAVVAAAARAGIGIDSLAPARVRPHDDRELVLDVARAEPIDLRRAIRALADALVAADPSGRRTAMPGLGRSRGAGARPSWPVGGGRPSVTRLDSALRVGAGRSGEG